MSENIIPAIIALIGVFISILASAIVSARQYRIEIQKIQTEYLHLYASKLFDHRMNAYSKIFESTLVIIQKINLKQPLHSRDLEVLGKEFIEWNAKYSSLLSANSEYLIHKLYIYLNSMPKQERSELVKSPEALKDFENRLLQFYLALKNDLGVYSLVSPTAITNFESPVTIKGVADLSKRKKEL